MDRLEAMGAFVAAVDRGSFSSAARLLGRSPASVTRAVAALEEHLGAELLRRTTRSQRLTEAGRRYLEVARRVLAELEDAERSAADVRSTPRGLLTATAPLGFGALHVRRLVDDYLAAYAEVRVNLLLLDRVVHLVEEGVDVAVRIGHLPDSALVAQSVGAVRRVVVASPEYLARHGRPRSPVELASHRCIAFSALTPGETWSFGARRGGERPKQVRVRPVLTVNVADGAIGAAIAGVGLTCAMSYQVAEAVRSGKLERVLRPFEPAPLPVQLVYPAGSVHTAKVRAFVELAGPRLRKTLAVTSHFNRFG